MQECEHRLGGILIVHSQSAINCDAGCTKSCGVNLSAVHISSVGIGRRAEGQGQRVPSLLERAGELHVGIHLRIHIVGLVVLFESLGHQAHELRLIAVGHVTRASVSGIAGGIIFEINSHIIGIHTFENFSTCNIRIGSIENITFRSYTSAYCYAFDVACFAYTECTFADNDKFARDDEFGEIFLYCIFLFVRAVIRLTVGAKEQVSRNEFCSFHAIVFLIAVSGIVINNCLYSQTLDETAIKEYTIVQLFDLSTVFQFEVCHVTAFSECLAVYSDIIATERHL